ncbi:MAG TPA: hypothetical protein PKK20_02960, partial [Verrucomicrobiota bacterium]|nr:hypothetical protein [Verrucomicrobiota bacterium]HOA60328.1 hypothetical protein [Verrucomicrobiota bacterium]HQA40688.1 hypothetical protein [Verrucomicrobiota bacterium]
CVDPSGRRGLSIRVRREWGLRRQPCGRASGHGGRRCYGVAVVQDGDRHGAQLVGELGQVAQGEPALLSPAHDLLPPLFVVVHGQGDLGMIQGRVDGGHRP